MILVSNSDVTIKNVIMDAEKMPLVAFSSMQLLMDKSKM